MSPGGCCVHSKASLGLGGVLIVLISVICALGKKSISHPLIALIFSYIYPSLYSLKCSKCWNKLNSYNRRYHLLCPATLYSNCDRSSAFLSTRCRCGQCLHHGSGSTKVLILHTHTHTHTICYIVQTLIFHTGEKP